MALLTPESVYAILAEYFPRKNDDFTSSYIEELAELKEFGIKTDKKLREMLAKHCREVLEIDASPMSDWDIAMHKTSSGNEFVTKRLEAGYWFSYPALLCITLELEFGNAYQQFCEKRDGFEKGSLAR
jgi:hypothetical protein